MLLIGFGLLLTVWEFVRVKTDFKKDKVSNNVIGLILSGQASGVGQLISGILTIVVGIIVFFMTK
ncbi:hypothetical protein DOK76_00510 [Vagococcus sp. DIV0080]|uniref:DUF350 domain-containing protein n=2 Tax=Candidatus Vagococcus giribetii TaxID=2230876 RepID=A0ABS3HP58_9ENTE|nr:hypothetical protein [Vagococcus sp. DIV0080]